LIDGTFVGDLVRIERQGLGKNDGSADPVRTACAFARQVVEHCAESGGDVFIPASVHIGDDQYGDVVAIVSGDDHIFRVGSRAVYEPGAQRSDADPRAGRKFEILGKAAIEGEAEVRPGFVDKQ
jgi:hypothetical protein